MSTRFKNLLLKERKCNLIFALIVLFNIVTFSVGINEKVQDNSDTLVDSLKLCIVWGNIVLFEILLFQKKIITNGSLLLKVLSSVAVVLLNTMCFVNIWLIVIVAQANDDNDTTVTTNQGANKDYLLLGISLATDICYLILYLIFRSKRSILIVILLIIIEVIIFSVSATTGSDEAIDIANLTIALVTTSLSILLWSSNVTLDDNGNTFELKDYWERVDLDESTENIISNKFDIEV